MVALVDKHSGLIEFGHRAVYDKLLLFSEHRISNTGMLSFLDDIEDPPVIQLTTVGTGGIHQSFENVVDIHDWSCLIA